MTQDTVNVQRGIVSAGADEDTYVLAPALIDANSDITISDSGVNTIQLIGGLEIVESEIGSTGLRLTLSNGAVVTILDADDYTFQTGGNPLLGESGVDRTFVEFVEDVLAASVPVSGTPPVSGGGASINSDGTIGGDEPEENVAPVADDETVNAVEDGSILNVNLSASDVNSGDLLTFSLDSAIPGFSLDASGNFALDPSNAVYQSLAAGEQTARFSSVTVEDGNGGSDAADVTVIVTGVNDAPAAVDDSRETEQGQAIEIAVLGNDSDVDGDELTVSAVDAINGTASIVAGDKAVRFTPADGFSGDAIVFYTVSDGNGGTDTGEVRITVTPEETPSDTAPVADDETINAVEGGGEIMGNLAATDADGDTLGFSLDAPIAGLTLASDGSYSFDPAVLAYNSIADGESEVLQTSFVVTDGSNSDRETITVVVDGTNDAPSAVDDSVATGQATAVVVDVLGNDTDPDEGDALEILEASTANGSVEVSEDGRSLTYTPPVSFSGVAEIGYTISDGNDGTASATVSVTVSQNQAPMIDTIAPVQVSEDGDNVGGAVAASDVDGDPLSFTLAAGVDIPGLTFNSDGSYSFTPSDPAYQSLAAGEFEVANASLTVSDGRGGEANGSLTLIVEGENDAPVAAGETFDVDEGKTTSIDVLANDSDIDEGDILSVEVISAQNGTATVNPDGTIAYTPSVNPAPGESVQADIEYRVSDGSGGEATATASVTVNGVNEPPVITPPQAIDVLEDGPSVSGSITATDPDGDDVQLAFALDAPMAGLTLDEAGYTFNPSDEAYQSLGAGQELALEAVGTVTDADGGEASETLSITVTGVNDAPGFDVEDASADVEENTTLVGVFTASDVDSGDAITYALDGVDADIFSIDAQTGEVRFIAAPDFEAVATSYAISVAAEDGSGATASQPVSVTVTDVNEAPGLAVTPNSPADEASTDAIEVDENTQAVALLSATDEDDNLNESADNFYALSGPDADLFTVSGGALAFRTAPNFENPRDTGGDNRYSVTVTIADEDGLTDERAIQVDVRDTLEDFVLTGDTDDYQGTAADETFVAPGTGGVTTLNSSDTIDGGDGEDTLNVYIGELELFDVPNIEQVGTIRNIEIVNLYNRASTTEGGAVPHGIVNSDSALDADGFPGAEQIWQIDAAACVKNVGSDTTIGFRDIESPATVSGCLDVDETTGPASISAALNGLLWNRKDLLNGGEEDYLAPEFDGTTANIALDNVYSGFTIVGRAADSVTGMNLSGSIADEEDGTAKDDYALPSLGQFHFVSEEFSNLATINLAMSTNVQLNSFLVGESETALTEIDASNSTGGIVMDFTAATSAQALDTLTGGSGDDRFFIDREATIGETVNISTNAGNDRVRIDGAELFTVDASGDPVTPDWTLDGGEGDDDRLILDLTDVNFVPETLNDFDFSNVSGFERLVFYWDKPGPIGIVPGGETLDLTGTGFTAFEFDESVQFGSGGSDENFSLVADSDFNRLVFGEGNALSSNGESVLSIGGSTASNGPTELTIDVDGIDLGTPTNIGNGAGSGGAILDFGSVQTATINFNEVSDGTTDTAANGRAAIKGENLTTLTVNVNAAAEGDGADPASLLQLGDLIADSLKTMTLNLGEAGRFGPADAGVGATPDDPTAASLETVTITGGADSTFAFGAGGTGQGALATIDLSGFSGDLDSGGADDAAGETDPSGVLGAAGQLDLSLAEGGTADDAFDGDVTVTLGTGDVHAQLATGDAASREILRFVGDDIGDVVVSGFSTLSATELLDTLVFTTDGLDEAPANFDLLDFSQFGAVSDASDLNIDTVAGGGTRLELRRHQRR